MNTDISWGQQGWICPKCGCVYAPHVDECRRCNGGSGSAIQGIGQGTIDAVPLPYKPQTAIPSDKWWEDYGLNISQTNTSIQDLVKSDNVNPPPVYYKGQPAIITNASEMADWFEDAQVISIETISEHFIKNDK